MLGRKASFHLRDDDLGLGALFHDIGKSPYNKKVLKKKGALTKARDGNNDSFIPRYGVDILRKLAESGRVAPVSFWNINESVQRSGITRPVWMGRKSVTARIINIVIAR